MVVEFERRYIVRFLDKVVLITGGSRGIGKAIALAFAKNGAKVITTSSRSDGDQLKHEIEKIGGVSLHIQSDVSNENSVREAVETAITKFGRIDILVNNAGIVIPGNLENTSVEEFDKTMEINVKGTFLMSKHTVPVMRNNGGGVIVNIGSVAALKGHIDRVAYCASKGAVVAMSRAMAAEYVKDGIRVNVVCPGTTMTPAIEEKIKNAEDPEVMRATFVNRQPLGRLGTADEIAEAVMFAACDEASYMTGSVLVIDGGMTM